MKRLLCFFVAILLILISNILQVSSQTVLSAGDIVIVAINGDTDDPNSFGRGFSFMPLVNLEAGTVINFTDYGWSDGIGAFITNTAVADAFIHYTAPTVITAGTVIRCDSYHTTNFTYDTSYSGLGNNWLNTAGLTQGDELLVFQGLRSSPTFICAASIVNNTLVPSGWATSVGANGTDGSGAGSALPPGLTDDVTALSFNQPSTANDNCSYTGTTTAATKAEWQLRIQSYTNWTFNDAIPIPTPPAGPFTVTDAAPLTSAPTITTTAAASIAATSATLGGNVTADGGATVDDRGVVYSLTSQNANPQVGGANVTKTQIGTGTGAFSQSIGSLTANSGYSFRAYAHNSEGYSYGSVSTFSTTPASSIPSGTGSEGDPYLISNLAELNWIAEQTNSGNTFSGKYLKQTADIDASATSTWNSDGSGGYYGWSPIGEYVAPNYYDFKGSYDGQGYVISNLYINRYDNQQFNVGLFGYCTSATFSNIGLVNASVRAYNSVGILVGVPETSTIQNCYSTGEVICSSNGGGLIGWDYFSTTSNCYSTASVNGIDATLAGDFNDIGGFAGVIDGGNLDNCYATGAVTGNTNIWIGGFAGESTDDIIANNCYSTGLVTSNGSSAYGGFLGTKTSGTLTGCFWDTETSGQATTADGTGKTTTQMKTESTFTSAGWDFRGETANGSNDYWDINSSRNNGYPFLSYQFPVAPEISITGNAVEILNGDVTPSSADHTSYGQVSIVSASFGRTFTIHNVGSQTLTLSDVGNNYVAISGHTADFSLTEIPSSSIEPGSSTTFQITFNPTTTGTRTATVSIANNDADENPYTFTIQGIGTAPEMDLKQGVTSIADGGSFDFSNHLLSSNTDVVFTIENTGAANLDVNTPITIGGANADQFSIQVQPGSLIIPTGTTTFTVRFTPTSTGAKTATISIANNDGNENPYDLTITGTGIAPEMDLKQGVTPIADGGSYDFSGQLLSGTKDVVFTIENSGTASLTFTTPFAIGGANADQFSIQSQPTSPVAASGTTTFTVRFAPTTTGAKTATISIANNDGNENPYDLTITGTGTAPEISITGNGNEILNGDVTPSTTDNTDFGSADITTGSVVRTFTINNIGSAELNLTGTPLVAISGANAADFSVTDAPATPIAASGSTTFNITFDPSAIGTRTATITIANDDADENPYTFAIKGTGSNVPTVQSQDITLTAATASTMQFGWTRGDGSNCVAFVKEGAASGTQTPADNSTYTPSTNWSAKGTEVGTGWYCVYNGSDANPSVSLTNLAAGELYRIVVFEYNSTPGNEKYLTTAAANNPRTFNTKATTAYLSADYDATHTGSEDNKYWSVRCFNDLATALTSSAANSTIHVSNYTHTGALDADANTYIIDAADFVVTGTITAATNQIQVIGTGYLVQTPVQNVAKTYPIGDGTNNYSATITCANAPSQPVKMKINNNKTVSGSSSVDFWDISGETGLNATIKLRIPKSALKSGSWSSSNQIRIYNGSRYVPVPAARVSTAVFADHVEVTITGVNVF